jgi:thiol-disulfide isomerase/thioredoxin
MNGTQIKRFFSLNNIISFAVLAIAIYFRGPEIMKNFRSEGIKLNTQKYNVITADGREAKILFPPEKYKAIAIFWASWCGPCKIEMNRLKSSVESGKISKVLIYAINPYETMPVVVKFITENTYPFTFIDSPDIARVLDIKSTPTTLFLKDNLITSMSSGLSVIGIWRAELFLLN